MIKKEFAKIGKQIIRQLSSTVEKYKDIEDHMDLDAHGNPTIKTVAEHHRLSKSQISQLIFYHFLHVDERGIICDVSEKEIRITLNCTVRTVRNNNVVLAETELISYSRGKGINICIVPYPQYFEEHGFGFMELEYTRFEELILIENVNALRLNVCAKNWFMTTIRLSVSLTLEKTLQKLALMTIKFLRRNILTTRV